MSKPNSLFSRNLIILLASSIVMVIIVVLILSFAFLQPVPLAKFGNAPDFNLVDQDNKNVSLKNYLGKVLVIDFIYTTCPDPDYCQLETTKMNTVLNNLKKSGYTSSDFHFISISFDWVNDNASAMKKYGEDRANSQFEYWSFLSGTHENIDNVTKAYHVTAMYFNTTTTSPFAKTLGKISAPNHDQMMHTMTLTIIDSQGVIRRSADSYNLGYYKNNDWKTDQITAEITSLLEEMKKTK